MDFTGLLAKWLLPCTVTASYRVRFPGRHHSIRRSCKTESCTTTWFLNQAPYHSAIATYVWNRKSCVWFCDFATSCSCCWANLLQSDHQLNVSWFVSVCFVLFVQGPWQRRKVSAARGIVLWTPPLSVNWIYAYKKKIATNNVFPNSGQFWFALYIFRI